MKNEEWRMEVSLYRLENQGEEHNHDSSFFIFYFVVSFS